MSDRWRWAPTRRVRLVVRVLLMLSAPLVSGCTLIESVVLQTAPGTEKVSAEFNRLPEKTVLVYVWVDAETKWAHPKVRLDLAAYLSEYLEQNVEDITVVDYYLVEDYLEKTNSFEVDLDKLARHFGADTIVHLSVYRLTLRDQGMHHFYRGRIGASVEVYDRSRPDEPPERIPLKDAEVAVPEEGVVGLANTTPAQIRQAKNPGPSVMGTATSSMATRHLSQQEKIQTSLS